MIGRRSGASRTRLPWWVACFVCANLCLGLSRCNAEEPFVSGVWLAQSEDRPAGNWIQGGIPPQLFLIITPNSIVYIQRKFEFPRVEPGAAMVDLVRESAWSLDLRALDEREGCVVGLTTTRNKVVKFSRGPGEQTVHFQVLRTKPQQVVETHRLVKRDFESVRESVEKWANSPRLSHPARTALQELIAAQAKSLTRVDGQSDPSPDPANLEATGYSEHNRPK